MFIDADNLDFRLAPGSPCIGTGRNGNDRGAIPYTTGINDTQKLPMEITLIANYPNPFNASTTISYSLTEPTSVTLEIYDILGRKVQTLQDGVQQSGEHNITWRADGFSSGVYFYKLDAGEFEQTRKMILIK